MTAPRYLLPVFALLLAAAAGAQEERPFGRAGVPRLTVDLTLLDVAGDGATRPVAPDHRFADGAFVAFELRASRGGYVRLAVPDDEAEDGLRGLWPEAPRGYPVASGQPTRLPPADVPPLQLTGESPTELAILFSPKPPERETAERRWLRQIDLREIDLAEAPAAAPRRLQFTGQAADGETMTMKVILTHDGGASDD